MAVKRYELNEVQWSALAHRSVWNTMVTFQGDPSMTTDDVIVMLKSEYESIFK